MLRSTPCGRRGASGSSPAMIRSVQSANISRAACRPIRFSPFDIEPPACPDWMRRSQAATIESNSPSSGGTSRVALLPSEWHAVQPPDLTVRIHSAWLRMFGEMPLPSGPVPGN